MLLAALMRLLLELSASAPNAAALVREGGMAVVINVIKLLLGEPSHGVVAISVEVRRHTVFHRRMGGVGVVLFVRQYSSFRDGGRVAHKDMGLEAGIAANADDHVAPSSIVAALLSNQIEHRTSNPETPRNAPNVEQVLWNALEHSATALDSGPSAPSRGELVLRRRKSNAMWALANEGALAALRQLFAALLLRGQ